MLCWWVGLGDDVALRSVMEKKTFLQWPPTTAVTGNIVFIHESNKAESVLKAFTARFRAHE